MDLGRYLHRCRFVRAGACAIGGLAKTAPDSYGRPDVPPDLVISVNSNDRTMKLATVGGRVRIMDHGATGTVDRVDANGRCWLTVDSFPWRIRLPQSQLVEVEEGEGRACPCQPALSNCT